MKLRGKRIFIFTLFFFIYLVEKMSRVVILIPAYNEEKTIAHIVIEASEYGDVIVCDDGSTDYTGVIAERLGAKVIRHDVNMGYGAALASLFKEAIKLNPTYVVTLDADLQHDPRYIPVLINALEEENADVAIGVRAADDETPLYRRIGVKVFSKLVSKSLSDVQSGFRVYRGDMVKDLIPKEVGMEASIEIIENILKRGLKIVEVPIKFRYVGLETSTYNPVSHGYSIFSRIIHDKILKKPMTYLGIPGFLITLAGFLAGIWVIIRYTAVKELAVGTAIITAILIITGFIFILIAIQTYAVKEYVKLNK